MTHEYDFEEFCTRLKVFGKNNITINANNLTGQNYIEDFSYFMHPFEIDDEDNIVEHSDYMSDGLCLALIAYNDLITSNQPTFNDYLSQLNTLEISLTTLENELDALNIEMTNILNNLAIAQENGEPTDDLIIQRDAKQVEIDSKQVEINIVENNIDNINDDINDLKTLLLKSTNFTSDQLIELNEFIFEREIVENEIDNSKDLYNYAVDKFLEINTPPIILKISIVNLLEVIECQKEWDKLILGDIVNVYHEKLNINITAKIIEIEYDFELGDINLTISNIERKLSKKDKVVKIINKTLKSTTSLEQEKSNWSIVATNFDNRNDRISTIPANPIIANDGTAIDHTINTDGSCDISFEWTFNPEGLDLIEYPEYNIDGFIVYVRSLSTDEPYIFGSTVAREQYYAIGTDKRAFILYGVASDKYFTFGIQAYRKVDVDINSSGVLKSSIVRSVYATENPYLPDANVAFSGNITGTINGVPASSIADTTAPTVGSIDTPIANSDNTVTITWSGFTDDESGIAGYNVWRAANSTGTNKIIVGTVSSANNLTFTDISSIHNTTYYYWVTCFDKCGNETVTPVTGWKEIIALNTNNPSVPSSISAFARIGKIDITWDNSSSNDVVAYRLEKSTNGTDYSALVIINTNNYTEYGIVETKANIANWKYRVKAIDIIGLESTTWVVSNAPNTDIYFPADGSAPNPPNTPTGSSGYDGSITVLWTHTSPSSDLYKYRVYRSEDNITYYNIIDIDKTTLTYIDTGLKNGQTYYYKISSLDYSGMESALSSASAGLLATDQVAPTPPNPTATGDLGAIGLTWTEVSEKGATYEIWRCSGGTWVDGSATKIATVAGSTSGDGGQGSYVDYDPPTATATTYTYKLKVIDAWGNISSFSTNSSSATSTIDFNGTVAGVDADSISKTPVTFIVADGTTSENVKRADYVVPSGATNAQVTINSAINALPTDGGKINLIEGTYIVNNSIIIPSNVELELSTGATIKIKDNHNSNIKVIVNSDTTDGNSNIKISGGRLFGNKQNNSDDDDYYGIYFEKVSSSEVIGVVIDYFWDNGFYLYYCDDNFISNNKFENTYSEPLELNYSNNNIITNNNCKSSGNSGGIGMFHSNNNTISNNVLNNNIFSGLYLFHSDYNNIVGNIALYNGTADAVYHWGNGIFLLDSNNNSIVSNAVSENYYDGICLTTISSVCDNNIIVGNICISNNQSGASSSISNIFLFGDCNYNNIQNNVCRKGSLTNKPDYGIKINSSDCNSNIVTNNDLSTGGNIASFSDAGTGTITTAGNRL
jgi:parallel beta-helix repeat protein